MTAQARYMIVETDDAGYKIVDRMTGVGLSFAPDRKPQPETKDDPATRIPRYAVACNIADVLNGIMP